MHWLSNCWGYEMCCFFYVYHLANSLRVQRMRLDRRTQLPHIVDLDLVHNVAEQISHPQLLLLADAGVLWDVSADLQFIRCVLESK